MDTAVTFPDPQLAVRDLLRELLADRPEAYAAGAVVSTKGPTGVLPYIQVRSDGSFRDARLNGRASIRVVVWHKDEGLGVSLAALAEGLLLAASSDRIRSASSLTGPIPTGDPDTGAPMSYFTITARLRPSQIT